MHFHLDKNLVDNYKTIGIPPMNSSSTCWIKPDDLKKLLEKNIINHIKNIYFIFKMSSQVPYPDKDSIAKLLSSENI